jgi:hypothetical protein
LVLDTARRKSAKKTPKILYKSEIQKNILTKYLKMSEEIKIDNKNLYYIYKLNLQLWQVVVASSNLKPLKSLKI